MKISIFKLRKKCPRTPKKERGQSGISIILKPKKPKN